MMAKNYYDWLEVSPVASSEVIEKAYKVLVKKYHPDLQDPANKQECENKLKMINEAYTILIDSEKRNQYDLQLKNNLKSDPNIEILRNENINLKQELDHLKNNQTNLYPPKITYTSSPLNYTQTTYIPQNKKFKKIFFHYLKNVIALCLTLLIIFVILQIPFIKTFFSNLFENNVILKSLTNIINTYFK